MPASSHVGSSGQAAHRSTGGTTRRPHQRAGLHQMQLTGAVRREAHDDVLDSGELVADQVHPLDDAFRMIGRRGQRHVAVEVGEAEIGMRGEERALMERLEVALGLPPPLEPAEVVVGQPRLDLASFFTCLAPAVQPATASA